VHWLLHVLGLDDSAGRPYLFWSGFGSDLAYLGMLGALARHVNCHEPWCWRLGRFPVEGTPWLACRRHHPAPPRRGSIREQYHLFLGERPGRG
jgi:hypothetical protein